MTYIPNKEHYTSLSTCFVQKPPQKMSIFCVKLFICMTVSSFSFLVFCIVPKENIEEIFLSLFLEGKTRHLYDVLICITCVACCLTVYYIPKINRKTNICYFLLHEFSMGATNLDAANLILCRLIRISYGICMSWSPKISVQDYCISFVWCNSYSWSSDHKNSFVVMDNYNSMTAWYVYLSSGICSLLLDV